MKLFLSVVMIIMGSCSALAQTPPLPDINAAKQMDDFLTQTFPPDQSIDTLIVIALKPFSEQHDIKDSNIYSKAYSLLIERSAHKEDFAAILAHQADFIAYWKALPPYDDWMRGRIVPLLLKLNPPEQYQPSLVKDYVSSVGGYYQADPTATAAIAALANHPAQGNNIILTLAPIIPTKLSYQAYYINGLLDVFAPYIPTASQEALDTLVTTRFELHKIIQQQYEGMQSNQSKGVRVNTIWDQATADEVEALFTRMDALICSKPLAPNITSWEYVDFQSEPPQINTKEPIQRLPCSVH